MKFRINFLFGIILSILCFCDAKAANTLDLTEALSEPCPQGCFCLGNGKIDPESAEIDKTICQQEHPNQGWNSESSGGFSMGNIEFVTDRKYGLADYYLDDFSEYYIGVYGFYGFKNNEFIYANSGQTRNNKNGSYYEKQYKNVFNCPMLYPHSVSGSKGLTDCFRYDENGNKIYYTKGTLSNNDTVNEEPEEIYENNRGNIDAIKALIQSGATGNTLDLTEALNDPNQSSGNTLDLTEALNGQNKQKKSSKKKSGGVNIEEAKAKIKAGISDASVKNKDLKSSEKTEAFKTSKMTTGKSMRASGNNRLGGNLEPVMNKSEKPSSNNSVDIDLETAKKMISAGI